MKIYVNGCSHSKCHLDIGIVSWPLLVNLFIENDYEDVGSESTLLKKSLLKKDESLTTYSKSKYVYDNHYRNVFLEFVKEKENYFISEATDAKGNDSILYETMESLRYLKKNGNLPDICIIQWSGHSRNLMTPILQEHSNILIPKEYVPQHKKSHNTQYRYCTPQNEFGNRLLLFEPSASLRTLNHMVILQEYLKSINVNYIFINYFPLDNQIKNLPILSELDLDKFVSYDKSTDPIFDGWIDKITKNKKYGLDLNKDKEGHPNINGMKLLYFRIINKINEIYSIGPIYTEDTIDKIIKPSIL